MKEHKIPPSVKQTSHIRSIDHQCIIEHPVNGMVDWQNWQSKKRNEWLGDALTIFSPQKKVNVNIYFSFEAIPYTHLFHSYALLRSSDRVNKVHCDVTDWCVWNNHTSKARRRCEQEHTGFETETHSNGNSGTEWIERRSMSKAVQKQKHRIKSRKIV